MKCRKCNLPIQKDDKICPHCGAKVKRPAKLIFLSSLALVFIMGAVIATFWFQDELPNITDQSAKQNPVSVTDSDEDKDQDKNDKAKENTKKKTSEKESEQKNKPSTKDDKTNKDQDDTKKPTKNENDEYIVGENAAPKDEPKIKKQKMDLEQKEETTNDTSLEEIQKTVYTVTTDEMQGSGFLYDWNGSVITNAHVVEGWTKATVQTGDGQSYTGNVIGYSNKTDVAVISVPALKGKKPASINAGGSFPIGEEIIALGSPNGASKTTYGFITGKDRSFVIGSFVYDHLYQISAPIASGSSGGPLITKNSKEIIAINSAQSTTDLSIGFSIPMNQVSGLIQSWINSPMSNDQLLAEFYGDDGDPMIGDEWDKEEGYFEEGDISEDDDHYNYWEDEEKDEDKDKEDEQEEVNKEDDQPSQNEEKDQDKDQEGSAESENEDQDDPDKEEVDEKDKTTNPEESTKDKEPKEKTDSPEHKKDEAA